MTVYGIAVRADLGFECNTPAASTERRGIEEMSDDGYVLITPARDEETYIGRTLESVVSQTRRPERWVVVSDGSTDGTDSLVQEYVDKYPFIALLRRTPERTRDFGSKVEAIDAGISCLNESKYAFIGVLDADLEFGVGYFESLLDFFSRDPKLGVGGGTYWEEKAGEFRPMEASRSRNIPGGVQLFRRECFEQIGGLLPLRFGGEDTVAGIMAGMHGWDIHCFGELPVKHLRPTGRAGRALFSARFREGRMDRVMGYHPLYELSKFVRRLAEKPYIVASVVRLSGYCWAVLSADPLGVPPHVVRYMRQEQMAMLKFPSGLKSRNKPQ